jgi:hypothetical protein
MIGLLLPSFPALESHRWLVEFVFFSELFWPPFIVIPLIIASVMTVRRSCEGLGVLLAWVSLGLGLWFFWTVSISQPL